MKIFVIGIDGGSFRVLDQYLRKPGSNYFRIKGISSYGILNSTFPPITGPAWTSFKTGMKPEHTGIFDWGILNNYYGRTFISSATCKYPDFWEYLERFGVSSIVYNVPVTFPPKKLKNSVLISGMFTPDKNSTFSNNTNIKSEILKNVPDFFIDVVKNEFRDKPKILFLKELAKMLRMRIKTFKYLIDNHSFSIAMVVFTVFDRLQHCLLDHFDREHPEYSEQKFKSVKTPLLEIFDIFDEFLGDLNKILGKEDYMVFVSDHGFGYNAGRFSINRWLAENGFLKVNEGRKKMISPVYQLMLKSGLTKQKIQRIMNRIGIKNTDKKISKFTRTAMMADWTKSKVYANSTEGIQINLKGREVNGIVEPGNEYKSLIKEIIIRLKEVKAPDGCELFEWVENSSEFLNHSTAFRYPDIFYSVAENRYVIDPSFSGKEVFSLDTYWDSGYHRKEGLFLVSGPGVKTGIYSEILNIFDVFPMICNLFSIDIPRNLDGIFPGFLFTDEFLKRNKVVFGEDINTMLSSEIPENNLVNQKDIEERLKGMGYL